MGDNRRESLTDSELLVMKVIWHTEEALTIQEISEKVNTVNRKMWDYKTVSVFLHHISKKGYLTKKRVGHTFYYYPLITENDYAQQEMSQCIDTCVNTWANGRIDFFFSTIMKTRQFSEEEKERIRRMIDGME